MPHLREMRWIIAAWPNTDRKERKRRVIDLKPVILSVGQSLSKRVAKGGNLGSSSLGLTSGVHTRTDPKGHQKFES